MNKKSCSLISVKYCVDDPPPYSNAISTQHQNNGTVNYACEVGFHSNQLPFTLRCASSDTDVEPYTWSEPSEPLVCSRGKFVPVFLAEVHCSNAVIAMHKVNDRKNSVI